MPEPRDRIDAPPGAPPLPVLIGGIASVVGTVVFVVSAIMMIVLWVAMLFDTMKWLGLILGLATAPLAAAYPLLHWIARGEFPVLYSGIWLVGVAGMVYSMSWAAYVRQRVEQMAPHAPELAPRESSAE